MTSSPPPAESELIDCQEPDPDAGSGLCGAAIVADERCLAHLTSEQLTAYLATLGPGANINARGVKFSRGLLTKVLRRFRAGLGASVGDADFRSAIFTEYASFFRVAFVKSANFDSANFAEGAHFYRGAFVKMLTSRTHPSAKALDSAA